MPLPKYDDWFRRSGGATNRPPQDPTDTFIVEVDALVQTYEKEPSEETRKKLKELIEQWWEHWKSKGVNLLDRRLNAEGALDDLAAAALAEKSTPPSQDFNIAMLVRDELSKIKIADVEFSPAVTMAAKAKMIDGKSLYDIVRAEWDTDEQDRGSPRAELDRATLFTKSPLTTPKVGAKAVAELVIKHGFAVCENIAMTFMHLCMQKGFGGRLEVIGIPYSSTSGHAVVVANRVGELKKPETWGDDYFVVDMWYFNLGMRHTAIWSGPSSKTYTNNEITPNCGTSGGLKSLLDSESWEGQSGGSIKGKLLSMLQENQKM